MYNMHMTRILISGYIGFDNFGDEVIFKVLREHLQELNYKVSALSKHSNYDIKTYNYKNLFEVIKAILNCDILISGGGSLLQNKTSNYSLIYYLLIITLAKLFFKKVIIFAQGIEPIKGKIFKKLTAFILKQCNFISVRDEKSQKLLLKNNIKSTLVSDPAYSLAQQKVSKENKNGLIIQLRDIKNIKKDFIQNLAHIISKHFNNVTVVAFQESYDKSICLEFVNEFKKLGKEACYIYNKDIEKTFDIINNSEFVISTRLHGLIISSALGCKVFALSYDEKIKTLVEELNISNIDLYNYNNNELDLKLEEFFKSDYQKYNYRKFIWDEIDKKLKEYNVK